MYAFLCSHINSSVCPFLFPFSMIPSPVPRYVLTASLLFIPPLHLSLHSIFVYFQIYLGLFSPLLVLLFFSYSQCLRSSILCLFLPSPTIIFYILCFLFCASSICLHYSFLLYVHLHPSTHNHYLHFLCLQIHFPCLHLFPFHLRLFSTVNTTGTLS